MVFSDLFFLFVFIPAFIVLYMLGAWMDRVLHRKYALGDSSGEISEAAARRRHAFKNAVLIVFSLIFYAWGEPIYVFLMLGVVVVNYLVGMGMGRADVKNRRRLWLTVGVIINLATLFSFKYLNFLAEILRDCGLDVADPKISLPIGISFYIFQSLSYLVDVYRRDTGPQRSFWGLLLYISMFPQLIAGPIVRYSTVAREIHDRRVTADDIADGVFRFLLGLGKKVIIANQLGEVCRQLLDGNLHDLSTGGAWIGMIAFSLQIYFDFSGYSDMAIGIGRCLGFHFCENFDHPYVSKSITEFWRRWHMSLGTFFRDYVYIPLGGSRRHQLVNIFVVWFLTGMWHGASWNFILWGLYFGIILVIEKHTILKIKDKIPAALLHFYAVAIVVMGFGIFYFDDFTRLRDFFSVAFGGGTEALSFADKNILFEKFWLFLAAILLAAPLRGGIARLSNRLLANHEVTRQGISLAVRLSFSLIILLVSIALLVGATNNAFLYTRF